MKKLLLLASISFTFITLQTQAKELDTLNKKAIYDRLDSFLIYTNEGNWSKVLDLTYNQLFLIVSKKDMMKVFEQMTDLGFEMKTSNYIITSYSEPVDYQTESFVLLKYSGTMEVFLTKDELKTTNMLGQLRTGFESDFGKENVKFDENNSKFIIHVIKSMYAISTQDKDNWEFLENNKSQEQIIQMLIPYSVRSKLDPKE